MFGIVIIFSFILNFFTKSIPFFWFSLSIFVILAIGLIISSIVFDIFVAKYREKLYDKLPIISSEDFESLLNNNRLKTYYPYGSVFETIEGNVFKVNMVIKPVDHPKYKDKVGSLLDGGDYFGNFQKEASKDNG